MKILIAGLLLICLLGCTKQTVNEKELEEPERLVAFEKSIVPRSIDEIDLLFKISAPVNEEGKMVLPVDIFSPSPLFNSLSMTELRITRFFASIRKLFPDTKPDVIRFTHHDIASKAIFSVDFDMKSINKIGSDFYDGTFFLFDNIKKFRVIDQEETKAMIHIYCQNKQNHLTSFCQKQSSLN